MIIKINSLESTIEIFYEKYVHLHGFVKLEAESDSKIYFIIIQIQNELVKRYDVPNKLITLNRKSTRLEVASWVLQELKNELPEDILHRSYIVEEYPTADRLEVERIPLKDF